MDVLLATTIATTAAMAAAIAMAIMAMAMAMAIFFVFVCADAKQITGLEVRSPDDKFKPNQRIQYFIPILFLFRKLAS